jgi:hypothetical protein
MAPWPRTTARSGLKSPTLSLTVPPYRFHDSRLNAAGEPEIDLGMVVTCDALALLASTGIGSLFTSCIRMGLPPLQLSGPLLHLRYTVLIPSSWLGRLSFS